MDELEERRQKGKTLRGLQRSADKRNYVVIYTFTGSAPQLCLSPVRDNMRCGMTWHGGKKKMIKKAIDWLS